MADQLESGPWGSRFPTLLLHPDSDGEWSPLEAQRLASELSVIEHEFAALPPVEFEPGSWQLTVSSMLGLRPKSLSECFMDIDGELLLSRLAKLAAVAVTHNRPISFQ